MSIEEKGIEVGQFWTTASGGVCMVSRIGNGFVRVRHVNKHGCFETKNFPNGTQLDDRIEEADAMRRAQLILSANLKNHFSLE